MLLDLDGELERTLVLLLRVLGVEKLALFRVLVRGVEFRTLELLFLVTLGLVKLLLVVLIDGLVKVLDLVVLRVLALMLS